MIYDNELRYLAQNKEIIILQWFDSLDKHFPGYFSYSELEETGNGFFQFLIDFDIPAGSHPHLYQVLQGEMPRRPIAVTI